jgi:hypothetical protein
MAKVKIEADDAEAILSLVDVLTLKRGPGCHFVDRRDRSKLSPFYAVAVMNCEAALKAQRQRPGPKVARRSAEHPR